MPVPSTQEIRKSLLEAFKGVAPHSFSNNQLLEVLSEYFGEDINEMSSSDKNTFKTRITEAKNYLKHNGLISTPSNQTYMLTKTGMKVLESNPEIIDDEYLASLKHEDFSLEPQIEVPETLPELIDTELEPEPEPVPLLA